MNEVALLFQALKKIIQYPTLSCLVVLLTLRHVWQIKQDREPIRDCGD